MKRKLKELKQTDFTMTIIKDLGLVSYGTQGKTTRYGVFECVKCKKHVSLRVSQVKTNKTGKCRECRIAEGNTKHGLYKDRLWRIWSGINSRCNNKSNKYYGAKNIRNLFDCFESFKEWSLMNGYTDELTIDRIDGESDYSKANCRWTTRSVQSRNTKMLYSNNTSGYRGVVLHKSTKKWIATIKVDSKNIFIGQYNTKEDARDAYNEYVLGNELEHTINLKA